MNLDTLRAIHIGGADPRIGQVAHLLVHGDYTQALEKVTAPNFPESLQGVEQRCLVFFATAHLVEARAEAEKLLERTLAEVGAAAAGPARRTLAERLWNIDLRQNYTQVLELLDPADDPDDLNVVELFRRRVLMADYAQCRGDYGLAGACLRTAGDLVDAVAADAERAACLVDYELANCRSLQGRHQFDEALSSIGRGLSVARESENTVAEIRLLIRRARTHFMLKDHEAGQRTFQEVIERHNACQLQPTGVVCWEEVRSEVLFTQGELLLFDRRPAAAERHLRQASDVALRIGSHEGYTEASVILTAAVMMQGRAADAIAQYKAARELCKASCYSDLSGDLDRLAMSRRFEKLSTAVQAASEVTS